jgi:hypothetical protein
MAAHPSPSNSLQRFYLNTREISSAESTESIINSEIQILKSFDVAREAAARINCLFKRVVTPAKVLDSAQSTFRKLGE